MQLHLFPKNICFFCCCISWIRFSFFYHWPFWLADGLDLISRARIVVVVGMNLLPSHSSELYRWSSERTPFPSTCRSKNDLLFNNLIFLVCFLGNNTATVHRDRQNQHSIKVPQTSFKIKMPPVLLLFTVDVVDVILCVLVTFTTDLSTHTFTTAKFPSPITLPTLYLSLMTDEETERFPFTVRRNVFSEVCLLVLFFS